MHDPASGRAKSKSPEHALAFRLGSEVGLSPAQQRVALDLTADHIERFYSDLRDPGVVVHPAVSAREPAGKPIRDCEVVAARLSLLHPSDFEVQREQGTVQARGLKLYRLCCEAREQGGLLSHEDLALLLCVDPSTVKDIVARLRDQGLVPPTRGAIKDIGPVPSHKEVIARLLGRGYSTSAVRAATKHSEHSIGRYQLQFGLVLYALHHWPQGSDDELCQLCGLSRGALQVYRAVAEELGEREDCRRHLERLRRRYEVDPEGLAQQVPAGKRPADLARSRLEQQTLQTALRQAVQEDLGTTRRVAETVADDLRRLIDDSFALTDRLRPGEITLFIDVHDPSFLSGEPVADRKVQPVTVPLYTEEARADWRRDEPVGRCRARVAVRVATAAQEQGGVMSVAGLAELLHTSPGTMSKDLRELAVALHVEAPTKGLIEDAGPTLTHKDWIVGLDDCGLTGEEITWLTRHAPASRDRYIETYRRVETLMRLQGRLPEPQEVARLLRLRLHVARQYTDLLRKHHGPGEDTQGSAGAATATAATEAASAPA